MEYNFDFSKINSIFLGQLFLNVIINFRSLCRAKIKTVKLTVAVIAGYILCSTPFVCVQIVVTFGNPPKAVCKFYFIHQIQKLISKLCILNSFSTKLVAYFDNHKKNAFKGQLSSKANFEVFI